MDYELEKLEEEYGKLKSLWDKLMVEWEHPSDWEDLYRVYPLLTTTAALSRRYTKKINPAVLIRLPESETAVLVDLSDYLYRDNKNFFNGKEESESLEKVAGILLHREDVVYMDDRRIDMRMRADTRVYLHVKSDVLCESCSFANNGKYEREKKNYKKKGCFAQYADCTCGWYIDMVSYLQALKFVIDSVTGKKEKDID